LKPTIPEASHRSISPVSFWPWGQKPRFYILPHPELRKGNSAPQGEVNSEARGRTIGELFRLITDLPFQKAFIFLVVVKAKPLDIQKSRN
tara:strand:+ start:181 stop:450 length:270 start_codon:yes stop_codon:yes gene_type:complete